MIEVYMTFQQNTLYRQNVKIDRIIFLDLREKIIFLKLCEGDIDLWIICYSGSFHYMCKLNTICRYNFD